MWEVDMQKKYVKLIGKKFRTNNLYLTFSLLLMKLRKNIKYRFLAQSIKAKDISTYLQIFSCFFIWIIKN